MIPDTAAAVSPSDGSRVALPRVGWFASVVFCGVLPALTIVALFVGTVHDDTVAFDFGPFYAAAGAVLHGASPYPLRDDPLTASSGAYVYPPLVAIVAVPFRILPLDIAGLLVMTLLVAAALAIPYVLGIRDWRCYGIVFLWPPVLTAIQTGNPTLLLALCAAVTWRVRDRALPAAASTGVTLAVKFVLWPLVVWLAATRRLASAVLACAVSSALLLLPWATIGFAGLTGYPDLLHRLERVVGRDAYTTSNLMLGLGVSSEIARAVWLMLGLALPAVVVLLGRRGDDRSAFIVAIAATLALSPLVWLHYFALLLVVVALAQPRLSPLWFVPLAMFVAPGTGHPTRVEIAIALGAAALTVALALRASLRENAPGSSESVPLPRSDVAAQTRST